MKPRKTRKDPGPQPHPSIVPADLPGIRRAPYPGFIEPCFPNLVDRPPSGDKWLHEMKFDGYRVQLHVHDAHPKVLTRRGVDWSDKFKNVLGVLVMLPTRDCIIDGEVVVLDKRGRSDFGLLQNSLRGGSRIALSAGLKGYSREAPIYGFQ